jgi:transposase InsO family protein
MSCEERTQSLIAAPGAGTGRQRFNVLYRNLQEGRISGASAQEKTSLPPGGAGPNLWQANQQWSLDFVSDALATGRGIRVLTVVDAFTRECLALETDTSLSGQRVTRALEQIIEQRGQP